MASATTETLRNSHHTGMSGRPREHVVVANYGWYLFNFIPLVCGNPREGASFPWVFFGDKVTSDVVQERLTSYAAAKGTHLAELNLYVNDNVLFELPGTSIPIPMPYVLCYKERLVSALLMDPPVAKAAAEETVVAPTAAPAADDAQKREVKRLLENIPDGGVK